MTLIPCLYHSLSALYDMAQLRFAKTSKLGSSWYVRADGTRSYFFTVDELCGLLRGAGFEIMEATCVKKVVVNRKQQSEMSRRFVQVRARAVGRREAAAHAEPVASAAVASSAPIPTDEIRSEGAQGP